MKNNSIYNQKGFSIAEVLVATTMATIVGLGVSNLTVSQSRNASHVEDRISYQNFSQELEDLIVSQNACQNTINNLVVPTALKSVSPNAATNLTEIRDSANQVIYNTTNRNTFDGLRIRSIQLKNQDLSGALTQGHALVEVQVERTRTPAGQNPQPLRPIVLKKQVTIDSTNRRILTCINEDLVSDPNEYPCLTTFRNVKPYPIAWDTAPIVTSHTIPSDAKYMTFSIPGSTSQVDNNNSSSNGDDRTDSDYSTRTTSGLSITAVLGKTKLRTGQVIEAGGRITMSGDNAYYNGIPLFTKGTTLRSFVAGGVSNLPLCDPAGFNASQKFVYSK